MTRLCRDVGVILVVMNEFCTTLKVAFGSTAKKSYGKYPDSINMSNKMESVYI